MLLHHFNPFFLKPLLIDFFCIRKKFLVFNLVSRNLKIKYRRSIIGYFWTLVSPLSMATTYYFIFKVLLKVRVEHYISFILTGSLAWTFFSQTLTEGIHSIVGNWGLISKVPLPIQVFPYVGVITNAFTFLSTIPILLAASFFSDVSLNASLSVLPFFFGALFLITYSLSFVLAILYVHLRDLSHLFTILLQIWFYATPVIYHESMVPEKYQWILHINPLGSIFRGLHHIFVDATWPPGALYLESLFWTAIILGGALLLQKYASSELVELI